MGDGVVSVWPGVFPLYAYHAPKAPMPAIAMGTLGTRIEDCRTGRWVLYLRIACEGTPTTWPCSDKVDLGTSLRRADRRAERRAKTAARRMGDDDRGGEMFIYSWLSFGKKTKRCKATAHHQKEDEMIDKRISLCSGD